MGKKQTAARPIAKANKLGDFVLNPYKFEKLDEAFKELCSDAYKRLNHKQKSEKVNHALLELILAAPEEVFLLIAIVEFIERIARENVLINYTFTSFEIWLNQFSGLSEAENYRVRAKVVGKFVPRDAYQILFPIGMGKRYPGSHFVTAHASPDLDTTVASFWGFVDAFGARVSEGTHIWNVPGGPPQSSIEVALLFYHIFGASCFEYTAKTRGSLALSSLELMTQRGVIKQGTNQSALSIDHERTQKAVILVDEAGYYLGDWRSFDVEGVRQVILLLNNCLRWFENHIHIDLISLFAKPKLKHSDLPKFVKSVLGIKIKDCEPVKEFSDKQKRYMNGYLQKVLKVGQGMNATFAQFSKAMEGLGLEDFQEAIEHIEALPDSDLFDSKGVLVEDRPKIFHHLEEIIAQLDEAIQSVRKYTERLEVALNIKSHVFGYLPQVVSYRADVDEVKSKMGNYPYLTVTSADEKGKMIPLGVVRSRDLQQPILGTVTTRDFCNRDETKIPSYFEVISVIDHHKCSLNTSSAPTAYISDAQSSNTVVAELAFAINDQHGTGGMSKEEIEAQIAKVQKDLKTPASRRIFSRLLARLNAAEQKEDYFVDPLREFVEYLHFLYAILDDTDLLTKVSRRDVDVVASLLNRLKSLMEGQEVEILHFDDLKHNETFVHRASIRILRHPDMYSLYQKIYIAKEHLVEENLELCAKGEESSIFVDTKLQNGLARIGQTKIFAKNYDAFSAHSEKLRDSFVARSNDFFADRREFDLYMHMISTVAGAEDLYTGADETYKHKDELWIWIPMTEQSIEHLKGFLHKFKTSPQIAAMEKKVEVEFQGPQGSELAKIFRESFLKDLKGQQKKGSGHSLSIIRYPAATINSRKAMISPYLPEIVD